MPRPADVFQIIHPSSPDFRTGGWEIEFGSWQWFYVAGMRTLMSRAGISNKSDLYNQVDLAATNIPERWKQIQSNGEWRSIAQNQVKRAISGEKMRLDKAVLAVLCLELAVETSGSKLDIYDFIQIRPAMFKLGRYSEVHANLNPAQIVALKNACRQQHTQLFDKEMKSGKAVTFRTADCTNKHLSDLYRDLNLFLIGTKKESMGTPSPSELPIFP